jgi:5-methylcytosine-specific restriction endonuclease McrA
MGFFRTSGAAAAGTVSKKRTKNVATLIEENAKLLQRIVRMKAAIEAGSTMIQCVACGKWADYRDMDGAHWISRTYTATKLTRENVHPQCQSCNRLRPDEIEADYTQFMIRTYGDKFVAELTERKYQVTKYSRAELEAMRDELEQEISFLEEMMPA